MTGKTLHIALLAILLTISTLSFAQQPDGLTCETAIPVDTAYRGSVPQAGTYYYSAWTYDLPMTCYFYPVETDMANPPSVEVDFTCTPGIYADPKVEDLVTSASSGWGIKVPIPFAFNSAIDEKTNQLYYTLTIKEFYREMMASYGISYNVQAFVKVTAPCAGKVRMAPDTAFQACVDNSHWLSLPDAMQAGVTHTEDSYVLPLSDWQNDSIRFCWTGTKAPVRVWIGEKCDFEMKTTGDNPALDYIDLSPDAGNGEHIYDYSKQAINDIINMFGRGGVYYARVASTEDAQVIIEYKPMSEAMARAILLQLDKPVQVAANDTAQVYYFPAKWQNKNILFSASTNKPVRAYFAKNVTFSTKKSDPILIDSCDFSLYNNGRGLGLSRTEMEILCKQTIGDYVFVKFVSPVATTITPTEWNVCDCVQRTKPILVNDSCRLPEQNTLTPWRIRYDEWAAQDVKLYWKGRAKLYVYLADTCQKFNLASSNQRVVFYHEFAIKRNGTTDTLTLTTSDMAKWRDRVDKDGYLYFRFNNSRAGDLLTFANVTEPEPAPDYQNATIFVECDESGDKLLISVSKEQDLQLLDEQGNVLESWHQKTNDNKQIVAIKIDTYHILLGECEIIQISQ